MSCWADTYSFPRFVSGFLPPVQWYQSFCGGWLWVVGCAEAKEFKRKEKKKICPAILQFWISFEISFLILEWKEIVFFRASQRGNGQKMRWMKIGGWRGWSGRGWSSGFERNLPGGKTLGDCSNPRKHRTSKERSSEVKKRVDHLENKSTRLHWTYFPKSRWPGSMRTFSPCVTVANLSVLLRIYSLLLSTNNLSEASPAFFPVEHPVSHWVYSFWNPGHFQDVKKTACGSA